MNQMNHAEATSSFPFPDAIVREDLLNLIVSCEPVLDWLAGKRILVTGGSGFIGSYLLEVLAFWNTLRPDRRCHVILPTRSEAALRERNPRLYAIFEGSWVEWSESHPLSYSAPGSDFIVHAASPTAPETCGGEPVAAAKAMVWLTEDVLEYASKYKPQRLVYISSGAVYGPQPPSMDAIPESYRGGPDVLRLDSWYAEAKRYCEYLCAASPVETIVARLFAFVGPYFDFSSRYALADFVRSAIERKCITIHGDGLAARTYCYASDMTAMLLHLLRSGAARNAYNVGVSSPVWTMRTLAEWIAHCIPGTRVEILGKERNEIRNQYIPDTSKITPLYAPQIVPEVGTTRMLASWASRGIVPHDRLAERICTDPGYGTPAAAIEPLTSGTR